MSIEIGILALVITLVMNVASFFGGRHVGAKETGKTEGTMVAKIEHLKEINDELKNSINEIKGLLRDEQKAHRDDYKKLRDEVNATAQKLREDMSESIRRVHDRIDGIIDGIEKR